MKLSPLYQWMEQKRKLLDWTRDFIQHHGFATYVELKR